MRAFFAIACALLAACSGGGSSGGASSSSGGIGATCGDADTSVVEGALSATGKTKSWAWVNIANPSNFDGTFEGGSVHLEWSGSTPDRVETPVTAATITVGTNSGPRVFQSGTLVYDSNDSESTLKASITFDSGTVNVCMRKNDR